MRINSNLPSLISYNAYNITQASLGKSIERLSTGLRVNSAADDAAGFAISEKMRAQVRGLDQASRNAQDGVSMIQIAEGALGEVHSILQRMRELSVQAANDTLTAQDRSYIQLEVTQLREEIDRISTTTQFNKKKLLDGSSSALWSSDKLSTEAVIRRSLTSKDQFGQKVVAEGNYKIEITAEPGEAQVQKSHLMSVEEDQVVSPAPTGGETADIPTPTVEIDINTVSGDGLGYTYAGGVLTLTDSAQVYRITGTGAATTNRVAVQSGVSSNVILSGVNINVSGIGNTVAFNCVGSASVHLFLEGSNTLTSGSGRAGLEVGPDATLVLDSAENGVLTATGGADGAGIGGRIGTMPGTFDPVANGGNITINGGEITAVAAGRAAGIGGGLCGNGGIITINGGVITARGSEGGAGIGSGNDGITGGIITITGGIFDVQGGGGIFGGAGGAGIGGGDRFGGGTTPTCDGGVISITGGSGTVRGGWGSAGIGGGTYSIGADITVDGEWDFGDVGNPATITTKDGQFVVNAGLVGGQPDDVQARNIGKGYRGATGTITKAGYTPTHAKKPKTLREIQAFYNANGVFTVDAPQTITIYQGDGKSAKVTLYGDDTMYDVAKKINDAIAHGLGQGLHVDNMRRFCTLSDGTAETSESIYSAEATEPYYTYTNEIYDDDGNVIQEAQQILAGYRNAYYSTMLVRSAIPGAMGELAFTGSEELLEALGLATIQESRESEFTATVYDAHSGALVNSAKVSGSLIQNAITDGVDVRFDPLADIEVTWNETEKRYEFRNADGVYSTVVHLADNTTTLQTGANEGEDFILSFADMSASALGLNGLLMVSRETASRSLGAIDHAIGRVSAMRATLGAYQNRLEHTITNLTTAATNTTASESRIRDADLAKEMVAFTKLNILSQAGTSMMAQANQLPQAALSLLRP